MALYRHSDGTVYCPGDVVGGVQTSRGMSAKAWADLACVPYTPPVAEPVPVEASIAVAAAELVASHPELPEKVRSVVAALQEAVSRGVALDLSCGIPGWDEIGQAFATAMALTADPRPILAVQARAQGSWFHYATKAGSFAEAYRLAAAVAAIGANA